jgi:hypothetical protein
MLRKMKSHKQTKIWLEKYNAQAPRPGDPAPDFELRDVHGDYPVRLSNLIGDRPVALIFGSFT